MRIGRRLMWVLHQIFRKIGTAAVLCRIALAATPTVAQAQQGQQQQPAQQATSAPAANAGPVQPWGLPPLPQGIGPVEKFADVGGTDQARFLEGGAFDNEGNFWFVSIGSG